MTEKITIAEIRDRGAFLLCTFQIVDVDDNNKLLYSQDAQITADKQNNLQYMKDIALLVFENYENKEANKTFLEGKKGQYFTKIQLQ